MHYPETKLIGTYKGTWTLKELFEELHPEVGKHDILECRGHMGSGPGPGGSPAGEGVLIDWITPLDALKGLGVYALTFKCASPEPIGTDADTPPKSKDAFQIMMDSGRQRKLPPAKTRR